MDNIPFLTVDDETISLSQALKYLKATGGFQRMLGEVLHQHLLTQELAQREDIQADPFQVDQAVMDFRTRSQLSDADRFQKWLSANNLSYTDFQNQIAFAIRVEKLKAQIGESELENYFQSRKPDLDQIALSRIIVDDSEVAKTLKSKLNDDISQFKALAQAHSLTADRALGGQMGTVRLGNLPQIIRTPLKSAQPGEIVGPITIDNRHCLFRVEGFLPAQLEGSLKIELQNEIFDRWLKEKLSQRKIKLEQQ